MSKQVPSKALFFAAGDVVAETNGEDAKTAKIRMLARSSQPIDHWYWGRMVHDLSGVKMKSRMPIDYCHDNAEVLGFLNKSEITDEGIYLSGALVPYGDDKAAEVVYKMGQGVPYEASINFGGDGILIEDVSEGMVTQVNGYQFAGPGVVIREWPLRGVAICPYGADANTESNLFSENDNKETKVEIMTEESESVEAAAVVDAPEAAELGAAVEGAEITPTPVAEEPKDAKAELSQYVAEFGFAAGAEMYLLGKSLADARLESVEKLKAENEELKAKVAQLSAGAAPTSFSQAEQKPRPKTLIEALANRKG